MEKTGIELIAEERQRQIEKEGWTIEHDLQHTNGELAIAGACYAGFTNCKDTPVLWPWSVRWWKPSRENRIKELQKAGALIAAEIDRLNNL